MAVIVIGGQCSKVGKTAVGCALMQALPEFHWTAIKTSSHQHGSEERLFLVEQDASEDTDTGRYRLAGAERAILISGVDAGTLPRLREEIQTAETTLIESNHVLEFIQPDVLLFVVDPENDDFKESARRWVAKSHALLVRSEKPDARLPTFVPRFVVGPEDWAPGGLIEFVRAKLAESYWSHR